jgi:hypothetical protein
MKKKAGQIVTEIIDGDFSLDSLKTIASSVQYLIEKKEASVHSKRLTV